MPKYDYKCEPCDEITELTHSMADDGPFTCDKCGGELRKTFTPAPVHFKGVGFYANDKSGPFIWGDKSSE